MPRLSPMPFIEVNGARLHYTSEGTGSETLVFAHGLLWSGRMFDAQVAALSDRYRCVTFDLRGQGQSEVTLGGYDMDTLAADAAALIEALGLGPVHFLGLSMGGFIGMRLAARRPELLRSLMLLETSADPEPEENRGRYRLLSLVARYLSLRLVRGRVMKIMFGKSFLEDPARAADRATWGARLVANDRIGITRAVTGVIDRAPVYDELARITVPTLILVGAEDVATPPPKAERMHAAIAGSRLFKVPAAGHTSTVENPAAVNARLEAFLAEVGHVAARDPAPSPAPAP